MLFINIHILAVIWIVTSFYVFYSMLGQNCSCHADTWNEKQEYRNWAILKIFINCHYKYFIHKLPTMLSTVRHSCTLKLKSIKWTSRVATKKSLNSNLVGEIFCNFWLTLTNQFNSQRRQCDSGFILRRMLNKLTNKEILKSLHQILFDLHLWNFGPS